MAPVIGFDASSTVGPRTGVGIATARLLDALAEELPRDWKLRVLVNSPRYPLPNDAWTRSPRLSIQLYKYPGKVLLKSWQYLGMPTAETLLGPLAIHHSPAGYITPVAHARRLIHVHDLHFLRRPPREDPYGGGYFAATYGRGLHEQDQIVCFSAQTRDDIVQHYPLVNPQRLAVIPHGVDSVHFQPEPNPDDAAVVRRHVGERPYFLVVGTVGTRKNLPFLVEVFARLLQDHKASNGLRPLLLLVGHKGKAQGMAELEASIQKHAMESDVLRPGYLPDAELPALYRHARAMVFPSLHEGFGLPVLEAMACGCPVLAARNPTMEEVTANAALLESGTDTAAFAAALQRLVGDEALRSQQRKAGLAHAARYSWRAAALETIAVYRRMLLRSAG